MPSIQAQIVSGQKMISVPGSKPMAADAAAMNKLRQSQPNLQPTTLGLEPSFGFGDRIGTATPGHVAALQQTGGGVKPIFPQQSIREMTRTKRSAQKVMDDACFGMLLAGYTGVTGADADHLKTAEDVDVTAGAGFVFFTIDPSAHVDFDADNYSAQQVAEKFKVVAGEVAWMDKYKGKSIKLATGATIKLDDATLTRAAVKYGRAINHTIGLGKHIDKVMAAKGRGYEIEMSVDETPQPTTLAEHYIIADQCMSAGMKVVSLAPRYIGDFEKGVDYKGDLAAFEKSFADHAAIAQMVGPYKLSLHSGSDKLSIYPIIARLTKGQFHVKTAGTSYLEALRVVARHDETLFRRIVEFGRAHYDVDKATYHVSATLKDAPEPTQHTPLKVLEREYLEIWSEVPAGKGFTKPGRQILHCTFGSVLTDPTLGPAVHAVLDRYLGTYTAVLAEHFSHHLRALHAGM